MALKRALIFLGPPGAGKGTQAKRIAKQLGVPHTFHRRHAEEVVARGTPAGLLAKPIMERGDLVPDPIVLEMVEERLSRRIARTDLFSTVFPRTPAAGGRTGRDSAAPRVGALPLVIEFRVSPGNAGAARGGCWTCTVGGETYNVFDLRPPKCGPDGNDGGKLVPSADDDRPEIVKERFRGVRAANQAAG